MRTDSPDRSAAQTPSAIGTRLVVAVFLAAAWVIVLGVMSVLTANPVTLNRAQILEAAEILTVQVEDARSGLVRVEKSWKGAIDDDQLRLRNLNETAARSGDRLLVPVSAVSDGWIITRSKLPGDPPLVYPASEDAEQQLRRLLNEVRRPSATQEKPDL